MTQDEFVTEMLLKENAQLKLENLRLKFALMAEKEKGDNEEKGDIED